MDFSLSVIAAVVSRVVFGVTDWLHLIASCLFALLIFSLGILTWKAVLLLISRDRKLEQLEHSQPRQVWFSSPGISVGLNRSTSTIIVTLQILSTERAELTHVQIDLRDSKTGMYILCKDSETAIIEKLVPTAKMIEQKISAKELDGCVRGALYQLNGYATFRDGERLIKVPISLVTIPSF